MKKFLFGQIFLISILLISTSCKYTPIYSAKNIEKITIDEVIFNGDKKINKYLQSKIKKYKTNNNQDGFKINFETSYNKDSISKNIAGKTTNFKISINIDINILRKNKNKNFTITKEFILKSFENKFEQNSYENIIIENLTEEIISELVILLSNYDN